MGRRKRAIEYGSTEMMNKGPPQLTCRPDMVCSVLNGSLRNLTRAVEKRRGCKRRICESKSVDDLDRFLEGRKRRDPSKVSRDETHIETQVDTDSKDSVTLADIRTTSGPSDISFWS
jgi:hypothetical protein